MGRLVFLDLKDIREKLESNFLKKICKKNF